MTGSKGQELWIISTQSDGFLTIYDPHEPMDSGQDPNDAGIAIYMIFIQTTFGKVNHLILPPEVCPSFLRARIKMCSLTGIYIYICIYIIIYYCFLRGRATKPTPKAFKGKRNTHSCGGEAGPLERKTPPRKRNQQKISPRTTHWTHRAKDQPHSTGSLSLYIYIYMCC